MLLWAIAWTVFEIASSLLLIIVGPRFLLNEHTTNLAIVIYALLAVGWMMLLPWLPAYLIPLTLVSRHTCLQCGYDLRASEGRCPECGTRISSSVVSLNEPAT